MPITTRVRVVLDIKTSGSWGDDCKLDQVRRQSMVEAELKLRKILYAGEGSASVVGEPKFITLTSHEGNDD